MDGQFEAWTHPGWAPTHGARCPAKKAELGLEARSRANARKKLELKGGMRSITRVP